MKDAETPFPNSPHLEEDTGGWGDPRPREVTAIKARGRREEEVAGFSGQHVILKQE